jgi:hypothetical protein
MSNDEPAGPHRRLIARLIVERQDLAGPVAVLLKATAKQKRRQEQKETPRAHNWGSYS